MSTFDQFNLPSTLKKAIAAMGFETPTPIQLKAIPLALAKKDIIGIAETGSGKTGAFAIPMIAHLIENPHSNALIIAPTRELAVQIESNWKKLTAGIPNFHSVIVIGGVAMGPQVRDLKRNPRLVIATPGRLCDHINRRTINMAKMNVLVLDEADRMLDMGFAPDLNMIARQLPKERHTMFFTATWDNNLDKLTKQYLRNPERIVIGTPSKTVDTVEQTVLSVNGADKNDLLLDLLNAHQGSVLVFTRTKHRTDRVAKYLNSFGIEVSRIHGGRSQAQRTAALHSFRIGESRVLVATDIAARGIDVANIAQIINYDIPKSPEDYVHRIGRSGRAGAVGAAVSMLAGEEKALWNEIAKLLKKSGSFVPTVTAAPKSATSGGQNAEPKIYTDKPEDYRRHERRAGARPRLQQNAKRFDEKRQVNETERPAKSTRPSFGSATPKFGGDRPARNERPSFGDRPARSERPSFDSRSPRSDRPSFGTKNALAKDRAPIRFQDGPRFDNRNERPARRDDRPATSEGSRSARPDFASAAGKVGFKPRASKFGRSSGKPARPGFAKSY